MLATNLIGTCIATMRYGCTVDFWCESKDGGVTDTRIVTLTFPTEAVAVAVAEAAAYRPA
jgi:hypothetical protein